MTPAQQDEVLHDPAYALHCLGSVVEQVSDAFLTAPVPPADVSELGALIARLWSIARTATVKSEAA
jgi:hypothetical protein